MHKYIKLGVLLIWVTLVVILAFIGFQCKPEVMCGIGLFCIVGSIILQRI